MSGILRLESLTKGNTLKQGDKTPLKYRLFDADGEKLNIAGKSAKVRLVYPDFLTIGYEKDGLTVAQDDTVTFTIDNVIPSRIYHVEIIVDDKFIFPSRADESKFTVDKSSLGTETNIIEIVGKEVLIQEVKSQVTTGLQPLVTSLESAQQAETQRVLAENERSEKYGSYAQQFSDVIKELSEEKDYHSLPEIAGARGGHETLGDRLDETTSQLAQKTQQSIINIKALGAKEDDKNFDNATIIQYAFDNYDVVIIEGVYYTSPLYINKKIIWRGSSQLVAYAKQNHIVQVSASHVQIENDVVLNGVYKAYHGMVISGGNRSYFNSVTGSRCLIYGIVLSKTGNNNLTSFNFAMAKQNGTELDLNYTKTSDTTVSIDNPITDVLLKEYAFYTSFPALDNRLANIITNVSEDGSVLTLHRSMDSTIPETGTIKVYIGGGLAILHHGGNNNVNISNLDTSSNKGSGLECSSSFSLYVSSFTSQFDRFGISTYQHCISLTIGKAYFEATSVNEVISRLYNNLVILGRPTIPDYTKDHINNGTGTTLVVERDLMKHNVQFETEPGTRKYSNDSDFSTVIVSKGFNKHTVNLDFVPDLHSSMRLQPISLFYFITSQINQVGRFTFNRSPNSMLSVEGHESITHEVPANSHVKFELVPVLGNQNMWKVLKTVYPVSDFIVNS